MDFSDLGEIGKILSYVAPVIIFLLVNVVFKKQQERRRKQTVIRGLLSEVNHNQKLVEAASFQWQAKKFKTRTWKSNRGKIDYISPALLSTLADTYDIAEEFNRAIDEAKKHKSASYMATIKMDRLSEPLIRSEQGLEEWLRENTEKKEMPKERFNLSR